MDPSSCITTLSRCVTASQIAKVLTCRILQSLLDDVRAHRIPVDYLELFHTARVPFYDGELHPPEQGLHFTL